MINVKLNESLPKFDMKQIPMQGYCLIDGSETLINKILQAKIGQSIDLNAPVACSYYTEQETDYRWSTSECEPIFRDILEQSPILSHWNQESRQILYQFFQHWGLSGIISSYAYHLLPKSILAISGGLCRQITNNGKRDFGDNYYLDLLRARAVENNCLILETLNQWNFKRFELAQVIIMSDRFLQETAMPVSFKKFGPKFETWYYQRSDRIRKIVLIDQGTKNWSMYSLDDHSVAEDYTYNFH